MDEKVKYNESKWATQEGPQGRKRSVYVYQQRTLNMPFLEVFDSPVCDESRPIRRASNTPLQALALLNGPLVNSEVGPFADRVAAEADDSIDSQVNRAFEIALCRPPDRDERLRFSQYLIDADEPNGNLRSLCRILLNCNEFLFLD